jgi:hypothetical protein
MGRDPDQAISATRTRNSASRPLPHKAGPKNEFDN